MSTRINYTQGLRSSTTRYGLIGALVVFPLALVKALLA